MKIKNITVPRLPPTYALSDGTVIGSQSVYLPPKKTRLIKNSSYHRVDGYDGTEQIITRAWLRDNVGRRIVHRAEVDGLKITRAPMYAEPAYIDEAVYIDLHSAYQSIYSVLGWGVDYERGKYLAAGREPLIYPYSKFKIGRSYVITGAYPRANITRIVGGVPRTNKIYNPLSNPPLVAAVYDILSAIARAAVSLFGAVYYNVDGAILPRSMADYYGDFLRAFGLNWSYKGDGTAYVTNLTNWTLGDIVTRHGRDANMQAGDWIPVSEAQAEWILEQYADVLRYRQGITA